MTPQIKTRDYSWDNIKAMLIFLVIFAHCLYGLRNRFINTLIVEYIYFFHMPAFTFVSGYFSWSKNARSKKSIISLLIAYMIFSLPFMVRDMLLGNSIQILSYYVSGWYLLAMVVWRLFTPFIIDIKNILYKITLFSLAIGFFESVSDMNAFAIGKVVVFYPFFIAGYLFPTESYRCHFRDLSLKKRLCLGGSFLMLGTILFLFSKYFLGAELSDTLPSAYKEFTIKAPVIRLSIFAVSAVMIRAMMYLTSDKAIPVLTSLGQNTLPIFVMHRIITMYYYGSKQITGLQARYQILGAILLSFLIMLAFGNKIFSRIFKQFTENCAAVLCGNSNNVKYSQWYKYGMTIVFLFIMAMPVIQHLLLTYKS